MDGRLVSTSPWDGAPVHDGPADGGLDTVLARAAAAWTAEVPPAVIRARLEQLSAVLTAHRAEAIALLIREAGKTRADATAEADLLPRKIAISLGAGLARTPLAPTPAAGPDLPAIRWRPRGVALCLGPFNFPLHLLHGLVVPALAVGCPVIAKPSERCPALGAWYRERLIEAGLGDRAQVVLGGPDTVRALANSSVVATVAAVGSRRMGLALAALLAPRPEVVLALELGGVNHALVCADADLAQALPALADGAWRMAGQRCTATRIVHVPRSRAEELIAGLRAAQRAWQGDRTPEGILGPLISSGERERFQQVFRPLAQASGWQVLAGTTTGDGAFADPLLLAVDPAGRAAPAYTDEHFGPYLIIDIFDDEAAAVARMRANPLRLSAAVWTADPANFQRLAQRLPYGLVNWNRNTAGARSDLPFGGCGQSGNGRPAAVAAGQIFADETVWG